MKLSVTPPKVSVRHNAITNRDELILTGDHEGLSAPEKAELYHAAVLTHGIKRGFIRQEDPEVSQILYFKNAGFRLGDDMYLLEQPWPGPEMPNDVGEYRLATPADSQVMEEMISASYGDKSDYRLPKDWIEQDMFISDDWFNIFVAEDSRDVGLGCATHVGDIGRIHGVCVRQEAQGRGQGRRLMRILIKEMQSRKHTKLEVAVSGDNDLAMTLYESFGFKNSDRRFVNIRYGFARHPAR